MKKNVFIIILVIIVLGMGGYLVYDKVLSKDEVKNEKKETVVTQDKNKEKVSENNELFSGLENTKVINKTEGVEYYLFEVGNGLNVSYSPNEKGTMTLQITYDKSLASSYGIDSSNLKDYNNLVEIVPDKKVLDIEIGNFSIDSSMYTILLLMEDGTVEYIPVYYALKDNNFKIYGQIEDLDQVVRLWTASAGQLGSTMLAQKSDGTIYDLHKMLPKPYYY